MEAWRASVAEDLQSPPGRSETNALNEPYVAHSGAETIDSGRHRLQSAAPTS